MKIIIVGLEGGNFEGFEHRGIKFAITRDGVVTPGLWEQRRRKLWNPPFGGNWEPPSGSRVQAVSAWIRENLTPQKTFSGRMGSYRWKHVAEDALGDYVANGDFILAALREGYGVEPMGVW